MGKRGKVKPRGKLYLVGTPIGNLEDITLRALRILREVDLIAAEDTRTTRKLLTRYDIHTPLVSYQGYREKEQSRLIVDLVVEGKRVALVSEAGMPTLSDPGFLAVRACVEAGYPAEVIPGPSALTAALSLSGYPLQRFYFAGFLPSKKGERRKLLEKLSSLEEVQVFFESPHRVRKTLEDFSSNFGERPIVLAREITKQHEEVLRGSARELLRKVEESSARGEYILILGPAVKPDKREDHALLEPLLREVEKLVQEGVSSSEACREVARREGVSRRELYNAYIKGAGDRH